MVFNFANIVTGKKGQPAPIKRMAALVDGRGKPATIKGMPSLVIVECCINLLMMA